MATIGNIAKASGISVEAIRYYEKQGLIAEPARDNNGYRQYSTDTTQRIQFIVNAKHAGLSLNEIKELLALSADASSQQVKTLIDEKLLEINHKLESLKSIQQTLQRLSKSCDGAKSIGDCPIMDAFKQKS
jgi:DNA-binding transcriptional MerR regulator